MAFDGIQHPAAELRYPYAYHPGAPATDDSIASALEAAYYCGRNNSVRLIEQVYPYNFRSPATAILNGGIVALTTNYIRIAEGYARAPLLSTHLRAFITFAAMPNLEGRAQHSMTATDGSTTVAGQVFERSIATVDSALVRNTNNNGQRWGPFVADQPFASTTTTEVEVAISTLTLTSVLKIYVEGRALEGLTFGTACEYKPLHIMIFAEVRG